MTPIVVAQGPAHDCKTDGHMIALRVTKHGITAVKITPFCELCRFVFLPSATMAGSQADWLMKQVDRARFAPDAPPEAYEGLYS